MQHTNFQTLLLLLQVAICEAAELSALPSLTGTPGPATVTAAWNKKNNIDPKAIGSTSVPAYQSWTTWSCPLGSTWTTLLPYGGCRTTASIQAPMYTGCANTSVLLGPFDNDTCTGTGAQTSCVTGWLHYDNNQTVTNYECWPTWTQGNWEAWRIEPHGLPLATVVAIAVVVPIVVIGAICAGLWYWRLRRSKMQPEKITMLESPLSGSTPPAHSAKSVNGTVRETKELEEQRRASELSAPMAPIAPHESIAGTMEQCEEEIEDESDDGRSYHTTDSRHPTHELDSSQDNSAENGAISERGALQRVLYRFRM